MTALKIQSKERLLPHGVEETEPTVCPKPAPTQDEEDPKVWADQDEEEPIIAAESKITSYQMNQKSITNVNPLSSQSVVQAIASRGETKTTCHANQKLKYFCGKKKTQA